MSPYYFSVQEKRAMVECIHRPIGISCPKMPTPGYIAKCTCPQRTAAGKCTCFMRVHHDIIEDSPFFCGGCDADQPAEPGNYP